MINPKISVIMPVYNREQYLKESIESILNQTFTDFEFIIVDDQSTDSSCQIIQEYASKDSRIVAVKNTGKKGCYSARNCGHRLAKGKYIAVMDSDDISLPKRLQTQFNFMEQNPDIDVCGSWAKIFGDTNERIVQTRLNHEEIRDEVFFHYPMFHPSLIFRNTNLILYSEEHFFAQDYELLCRKIDELKFANIPEVLLLYRAHQNQISSASKIEQGKNNDETRFRNIENIGLSLSDEEKQIYLDILNWTFSPKNKKELLLASQMLDNISVAGSKHGYKQLFQDTIRNFIKNLPDHGIKNKATSLKLYFTIFRKWKLFKTPWANLRYIYHCLRNLLHV